MSMDGVDAKGMEKFKEVNAYSYQQQAIFFLNAMWVEHKDEAEKVWMFTQKMIEQDKRKAAGSSLDEFEAHKFLESLGETLTVIAMREKLRKIDLDSDGKMSLTEYLVFRFNVKVKVLLERPQGQNEQLLAAEVALQEVQTEIEKIEKEKARLEAASQQDGVKGNTAKAELAKLLGQDQLPLNRAIITAEAAVRKASKLGLADCLGKIFWMEREIAEAKKYKPKSKQ